ncbi:hypothetical protein ACIRP7_42470 [Streptomyces sp. NPDC102270]|uniref:hypothetical protein n=1 Tax=Streptomyces sp. NPDC102270 TaxID=3366150 RepID=UPI00382D9DC0
MSENNDRPKPPPRRTGRTLGGAKKTTPPPPPGAELTPEQIATEKTIPQDEFRPAPASEPQVQPTTSTAPIEESAQDRTETVPKAAQTLVEPTVEAAPNAPARETANSQWAPPATTARQPWQPPAGEPVEQQMPPTDPTAKSTALTVPPIQPHEHASHYGPAHAPAASTAATPLAEVAIRPTSAPVAGTTSFPVRTEAPGLQQEQSGRPETAPSEGTPWTHGPGRPRDIPETAVILNQRIITRESLDSSVPAALKLKRRIKRFALDNELDHLPLGDIVAVAMDEWLSTRGF